MKAKQMEVQVQDLQDIKMDIAIRISKGKLLSRKEFEIAVQEGYFNDVPYSLYKLTMYTDDERDAQINLNHAQFMEIVDSLKQYFGGGIYVIQRKLLWYLSRRDQERIPLARTDRTVQEVWFCR